MPAQDEIKVHKTRQHLGPFCGTREMIVRTSGAWSKVTCEACLKTKPNKSTESARTRGYVVRRLQKEWEDGDDL